MVSLLTDHSFHRSLIPFLSVLSLMLWVVYKAIAN